MNWRSIFQRKSLRSPAESSQVFHHDVWRYMQMYGCELPFEEFRERLLLAKLDERWRGYMRIQHPLFFQICAEYGIIPEWRAHQRTWQLIGSGDQN